MPLLLHFPSKQMILAGLTGNTATPELWKSACNIYLGHLCEELSVKNFSPPYCVFQLQPSISVQILQTGLLFTKKKDNGVTCPSARRLFAPPIAVHSLKLQQVWRAISHLLIVNQVLFQRYLVLRNSPIKAVKTEIQRAAINLFLSCGPASACSKLYGEQQQDKRRNGKKCSLETLSKLCTGQILQTKRS